MGGYNLTGLAAGSGTGDSARYDELALKANLISPDLVTPNLGTPSAGVLTNCTGTAAGLSIGGNAATVTTNANLTGAVTSVGNAASLGSFTSAQLATALTDETGSGANVFATSPTLTSPAIAGTPTGVGVLTSGTAVASTSGTSIDFTGIPSWVKRITVMFNEVSLSGTSDFLVQLGDSGGIETTGYITTWGLTDAGGGGGTSTTGYFIRSGAGTVICSGLMVFLNATGNLWVGTSTAKISTSVLSLAAGTKSLTDVLTQIRITTVNGTDTFDAGSINIMYE
jgi:hypothetical protein